MDTKEWSKVTYEDLMKLYVDKGFTDREIAEYYGVTKGQVAYKRKKIGLRKTYINYMRFMNDQNSDINREANQHIKEHLLSLDTDTISRAIAHYIFRNGPVEDMHSNGQLSQNDMKTLNKYMNNRIATIIYLMKKGDWIRINLLIAVESLYGSSWDKAELCIDEIDTLAGFLLK